MPRLRAGGGRKLPPRGLGLIIHTSENAVLPSRLGEELDRGYAQVARNLSHLSGTSLQHLHTGHRN